MFDHILETQNKAICIFLSVFSHVSAQFVQDAPVKVRFYKGLVRLALEHRDEHLG